MRNVLLGMILGAMLSVLILGDEKPKSAKPEPLSPSEKIFLVAELLERATNDLGLDVHNITDENYPPKVIVTNQEMIEHIVCKNNGCVALGAANQDAIFIADSIDLRSVKGKGILFHEIVHALQNIQFGRASYDCDEWVRREEEAYALQNKWVSERGLDDPWLTQVLEKQKQVCDEWIGGGY